MTSQKERRMKWLNIAITISWTQKKKLNFKKKKKEKKS